MSQPKAFHNGRVVLHGGDCLEILDGLPEASVDAIVTDPPYHLLSTVKRFAKSGGADRLHNGDNQYGRLSRGFMGKEWDGGDIAFRAETWAKVLRVLKPGGHLVAFSAPKCAHRMICAIEDAGFEIRDGLMWVFGSGFPKSHDVSKAIDKAAGVKREKIAVGAPVKRMIPGADQNNGGSWIKDNGREYQPGMEIPATDAARAWQGWGTALKPAYEPICLARKPLAEPNVAANVLKWGTGAINVDGCRIAAPDGVPKFAPAGGDALNCYGDGLNRSNRTGELDTATGRFPANLCHDGSADVVALFPLTASGVKTGGQYARAAGVHEGGQRKDGTSCFGDEGSAARFFYSAKADANDRAFSKHPTVKPIALMRWLVRMVTPPGGTILDPFAGTGTSAHAALLEGFNAVLIEREEEYRADIARRMKLVFAGSVEKASMEATKPASDLPMFAGLE